MRKWVVSLAVLAGLSGSAAAGEIAAGLGYDGVIDDPGGDGAVVAGIDLRAAPLIEIWRIDLTLGAALEIDTDTDFWAGGGIAAELALSDRIRLEGSVMAGGYIADANGTQLGGGPIFRSRLGLGYRIAECLRLGLAFEHKSNAGSDDSNPGIETVFLTLAYQFDAF